MVVNAKYFEILQLEHVLSLVSVGRDRGNTEDFSGPKTNYINSKDVMLSVWPLFVY